MTTHQTDVLALENLSQKKKKRQKIRKKDLFTILVTNLLWHLQQVCVAYKIFMVNQSAYT